MTCTSYGNVLLKYPVVDKNILLIWLRRLKRLNKIVIRWYEHVTNYAKSYLHLKYNYVCLFILHVCLFILHGQISLNRASESDNHPTCS